MRREEKGGLGLREDDDRRKEDERREAEGKGG